MCFVEPSAIMSSDTAARDISGQCSCWGNGVLNAGQCRGQGPVQRTHPRDAAAAHLGHSGPENCPLSALLLPTQPSGQFITPELHQYKPMQTIQSTHISNSTLILTPILSLRSLLIIPVSALSALMVYQRGPRINIRRWMCFSGLQNPKTISVLVCFSVINCFCETTCAWKLPCKSFSFWSAGHGKSMEMKWMFLPNLILFANEELRWEDNGIMRVAAIRDPFAPQKQYYKKIQRSKIGLIRIG